MAKGLDARFEDCLQKKKITKLSKAGAMVQKELRVAREDMSVAEEGLKNKRWKWSTIQAYYSMFHTARTLLYSAGYREKSHYCLRVALETLFVNAGKLDERHIDALQIAKVMRENADYEEEFSEQGARKLVLAAKDFIEVTESILSR